MVQTNNKERVVVGVDGSPQSVAALRWALAHAQAGTVVEAVMAWEVPPSYGVGPTVSDGEDLGEAAAEQLAATVARTAGANLGVTVDTQVRRGHPAAVLVAASKGADLLVVGSHGRRGFLEALLGSVSHSCVQHAGCPVLVVRDETGPGTDRT